jgi:uncharacterized protein (TIGR03067 family)
MALIVGCGKNDATNATTTTQPSQVSAEEELAKFQGDWDVIDFAGPNEMKRKDANDPDNPLPRFKGNLLMLNRTQPDSGYAAITLNPNANPKTIDFIPAKPDGKTVDELPPKSFQFFGPGNRFLGIYRFESDGTLILSWVFPKKPRPTAFIPLAASPETGFGSVVMTLKKAK